MYLNSGDWIENLTALEYNDGKWIIYKYDDANITDSIDEDNEGYEPDNKELFSNMLHEFNMMNIT